MIINLYSVLRRTFYFKANKGSLVNSSSMILSIAKEMFKRKVKKLAHTSESQLKNKILQEHFLTYHEMVKQVTWVYYDIIICRILR